MGCTASTQPLTLNADQLLAAVDARDQEYKVPPCSWVPIFSVAARRTELLDAFHFADAKNMDIVKAAHRNLVFAVIPLPRDQQHCKAWTSIEGCVGYIAPPASHPALVCLMFTDPATATQTREALLKKKTWHTVPMPKTFAAKDLVRATFLLEQKRKRLMSTSAKDATYAPSAELAAPAPRCGALATKPTKAPSTAGAAVAATEIGYALHPRAEETQPLRCIAAR